MRYSRFPFVENTISNSPEVTRAKFLGSNGIFCFINRCKFGSFKNLCAMITSLLKLTLESEGFSLWYKQKKWFPWTMAAAQAAENHGDEWGLTWYFLWGIYTSIGTWTHWKNSIAAAEAPSLKITYVFEWLYLTQCLLFLLSLVFLHGFWFYFIQKGWGSLNQPICCVWSFNTHHKDCLTYSGGTENLVNSVIIFYIKRSYPDS